MEPGSEDDLCHQLPHIRTLPHTHSSPECLSVVTTNSNADPAAKFGTNCAYTSSHRVSYHHAHNSSHSSTHWHPVHNTN
jgi:hypothetical protein